MVYTHFVREVIPLLLSLIPRQNFFGNLDAIIIWCTPPYKRAFLKLDGVEMTQFLYFTSEGRELERAAIYLFTSAKCTLHVALKTRTETTFGNLKGSRCKLGHAATIP